MEGLFICLPFRQIGGGIFDEIECFELSETGENLPNLKMPEKGRSEWTVGTIETPFGRSSLKIYL